MTYEEIIQALRICFRDLDDGAACPNCPLYGNENCLAEVMGGAANLLEWLSGANAHLYEELRLQAMSAMAGFWVVCIFTTRKNKPLRHGTGG